ncbi:baseplate J/gp47 family protein [Patescibacteria group bacterium]|nr:baseplate J/gp47 family protein [Patescibacteria group bacterium]
MSIELGKIKTGRTYTPYIIFFFLACVAIVAGVFYFAFSKTTVTLFPKVDTSTASMNVAVSESATGNLSSFNAVKGRLLEKEVKSSKVFNQVEKKEVDTYAKGTVTLFNKRDQAQTLIANTQLQSSEGLIFKTDSWANIPAGGSVDVAVTAVDKGASGNIAPSRFNVVKLWSGLQEVIYGESTEAMKDGRVTDHVVTTETLEQAQQAVAKEIASEIITEFKGTLSEGEALDVEATSREITKYTPKAKDGDITPQFEVAMEVKVVAVVFDQAMVKKLAEEKIKNQINQSKEIINFNQDSLGYRLKDFDLEKKNATLEVTASAETRNKIPSKAFEKGDLVGRNYGDLIAYYKQFPEVQDIEIKFSPFWVSRVPANEENVEIKIK